MDNNLEKKVEELEARVDYLSQSLCKAIKVQGVLIDKLKDAVEIIDKVSETSKLNTKTLEMLINNH
jgi:hypothetical protein